MKKWKQRWCGVWTLAIILCTLFSSQIEASQSDIDQVQDEIEELENKKEDAKGQAEDFSNSASGLEGELKELDTRLSNAASQLNQTQEQLLSTQQSLAETQAALDEARIRETQQYEAMKKRIRFMYEMDTESMIEILMESDSIVDFLNKGVYIKNIYDYDRKMLEDYQGTKEVIAQNEQKLLEEEAELTALKAQQEESKQEVAGLLNQTSEKLKGAKQQLAKAQADIASYEAEIDRQKAYEEELEAQKAAEDAKRLEEIRQQEAENLGDVIVSSDASDIALLAALIQCEADGESYEGKLAVGSVVMNRVRSSYFPNTVAGVIYQSGQFSPVASGRFAAVLAGGANSTCVQAAAEVLGGRITLNCLYFRTNTGVVSGIVIGNHVFY